MDKIKIIRQSGQFSGLKDDDKEIVNIKTSEINSRNNVFSSFFNNFLNENKARNVKIVRLLIDVEAVDYEKLIKILNNIYTKNPNIEFHINIEFDKFFEYAKKIMSDTSFIKKSITLWPDGELKDRSYLNLKDLNCITMIPIQYAMWHTDIQNADSNNILFFRSDNELRDGKTPFSFETNVKRKNNNVFTPDNVHLYDLELALALSNTVYKFLNTDLKNVIECNNLSDDEKVLLIMKYFVDNFKYTFDSKVSENGITLFYTTLCSRGANVLFTKGGVCVGIAEAFMMLLNNPLLRVDCRILYGDYFSAGHAWNVANLFDKNTQQYNWFHFDPTVNITREDALYRTFIDDSERRMEFDIFRGPNPQYNSSGNKKYDRKTMEQLLKNALEKLHPKTTIILRTDTENALETPISKNTITINKDITYKNDAGDVVSKDEFDRERSLFEQDVENVYNSKANALISRINSVAKTDLEKLWMLFDYLTSENMLYDLQGTTQDGRRAIDNGYSFSNYKTWRIFQHTKYPALINNSGICTTFSKAFEDLSNKLGIPCRVIEGFTGMEHAWNIVLINNEIKHIDIAFAIMNRNNRNKKDFFLKDFGELGYRTIDSSIQDLKAEMKQQYSELHPRIKIISRTDIPQEPKITTIYRTDIPTDKHKITIISRTDIDNNKRRR